jgi:hypothetical protein
MRYAAVESRYAEPIAEALVSAPSFRAWFLRRTVFSEFADEARILDREILAKRSRTARNYWQSHYTHSCSCAGCRGQETDLLAVFKTPMGRPFAVHVEVKQPRDGFNPGQASAYPIRAECWRKNAPKTVVGHYEATTMLLCCAHKLAEYAVDCEQFATVITFQDIQESFPSILALSSGA